ncbi:MAG: cytochrome P450 [Deltaproteobacteria bacterium]|nr:cytochrome P450 [Deltaproteobacteria bacterium]
MSVSTATHQKSSTPPPNAERPPGPPPRRGGLHSLGYFWRFASDPLGFVEQRFERYGDIYYAPSDGQGLFVLRHPDHIREVLALRSSKFRKQHSAMRRLSQVLGQGLLTADGEAWKRHRTMIQPAFHRARLSSYAALMVEQTERAIADWKDGEVRDIGREMVDLTLQVVSRALFSHDAGGQTDTVASAMTTLNTVMGRPDLLPRWMPSPMRARVRRVVGQLDGLVYDLIDQRREAVARGGARGHDDLLQSLVVAVDEQGGGGLSRKEVRDELVTLLLAGHETTSHALSWTWLLLSRNPGHRQQLHDELDQVLQGRVPAFDDLPALPLSERVLKESMRLFPPAFVLARRAVEDTQIGGYAVPAGSEVIIWTRMTHRDARFYPAPEVFDPDRFTPQAEAARPKMSYLPFGGGPRACIGAQFSLVEARLVLATIARRFELDLLPGQRVREKPGVTLAPRGALRMRLRRRA